MNGGAEGGPTLAAEEGFELYSDLLDAMAALHAGSARDPFADAGCRPGPELYSDIAWRPKSEERQQFGERVEPTEDLTVPRCEVRQGAVEFVLRHGAGAVGKRLAVIVNGARSTLIRPEAPEPGATSRDVALSLPLDKAAGDKIFVEVVQEQRLVFSRAYRASDGAPVESAQQTPQIIEFRRFDGKALHLGVKRMDGVEPQPTLMIRFSFDGEERCASAELDLAAVKAESVQSPYRLPIAQLIAPSRVHDVVILGSGAADKVRKGGFSVVSIGGDHFWLSRPVATPGGAVATIVRADERRGGISAALSRDAGREVMGRPTADPAGFRFRKGENSFAFTLQSSLEDFRTLRVRDEAGAPLFDVEL